MKTYHSYVIHGSHTDALKLEKALKAKKYESYHYGHTPRILRTPAPSSVVHKLALELGIITSRRFSRDD